MPPVPTAAALAVIVGLALMLSGCGDSSGGSRSATASETTSIATVPLDARAIERDITNAKVTSGVLDFIAYCKRVTAGKDVSDEAHDRAFDGVNAVIEVAHANPDLRLNTDITPRRALGDLLTVAREDCDESAANRLEATIATLPPP